MSKLIRQINIKWFVICIVWMAICNCEVNSQNLTNQEFWHLTPEDGLSQSSVTAITQDGEGFMWFGTSEGLNRYDGLNMVVYRSSDDSTSLPNDDISLLYEDSQQNLWIGTGGGLGLYIREKDYFKTYTSPDVHDPQSNRLSENTINDIYEDSQGNLWIATFNGLNRLNRETEVFNTFYHDENDPKSLSANNILALFEDSNGDFWVGTREGIDLMVQRNGTFKRFHSEFDVPGASTYIEFIEEDSKQRLWVGTDNGLYYLDRDLGKLNNINKIIDAPEILSSVSMLSFWEDERGVLWVGTENEGLFAIDEKTDETYHFTSSPDNLNGINKNSIYALYESRDNILWIGTFDGGINYLNRKKPDFDHFVQQPNKKHSLNNNSIFSFVEDYQGNFWVGTDGGGLNRFDRKNELFFPIVHDPENENSLPSDVVLDLYEDSNNHLWIGTYRGGLSRYEVENQSFETFKPDLDNSATIRQNEIFAVYEDKNGTIWVGTNGQGLSKMLDEEKALFKHYQNSQENSDGLTNNYIRDIFEDSKGRFWIGSYGRGVILMNREKETFIDYNRYNDKLDGNVVLNILEDKNGKIWVGTKGGGISYYEEASDRFIAYTKNEGLPNNTINGMLEDDHGNLWLSTNDGISKFNPEAETFKNYGVKDGLQSREFKPGAAYKDKEGFMYFGGINGFNRFHPDSVSQDLEVPPVVFTDFQVFNKSVSIAGDSPLKKHINYAEVIELPYTASVITFKFAALNFGLGTQSSYAYKLEGFDIDWNNVGSQNTATYTNLDPGEYTFQLKAANTSGIWGDQIKQVGLIITPPFWQTSWFYLLAGLSIVGLIVGGFRYRTRQITEHNRRLEQEVSKRTSELRESNQELKRALKDLKETREELVENAHKAGMADIATGVLHNIGNVLNSVTTSTSITADVLEKSKLNKLFKANELLREHKDNLEEFLTHDPKGQKLTEYYLRLDEALKEELKVLKNHNKRLDKKVALINDVISAQQSYASVGIHHETSDVNLMLEDALTIFSNSLHRHSITLEKHIEQTPPVWVQKTKLVHVILNILQNAKDAMATSGLDEKRLVIKLYEQEGQVWLEISDTGSGIKQGHIDKIFTHGFTTKKNGHGFGLHSSANYMTEMGGKINVRNKKEGTGAVFSLSFPVKTEKAKDIT